MIRTPPDPRAFIDDSGPFDLIGDIHGCFDELVSLLARLGYDRRDVHDWHHPKGRRLVFLGDLVDRGPDSPAVLRTVMSTLAGGRGHCVVGNHDDKFRRWLAGRDVKLTHGLSETIEQVQAEPVDFRRELLAFIDTLPHHLILDQGRLIVAHAGVQADMHGEDSKRVRAFAMFGEVTGERDAHGLPVRLDWARNYAGEATVVHGHIAEPDVRERNNVICVDTGCVFGGHLTALRWPERERVQVPAQQTYYHSPRWADDVADD
ncbi:metallophosphoesterase [Maricaulis maris]|jgi:protein phosphatase|uniref:metallophosphoesterase n=1 Tax=Maricaulis maris TaxID=74318 RepID=UPI0026F04FAA|nr:metallophosphoesterase [Maricaulis maris]